MLYTVPVKYMAGAENKINTLMTYCTTHDKILKIKSTL